MPITDYLASEDARIAAFPVAAERVFLGHAGVCPLPAVAADAMRHFLDAATRDMQECPPVVPYVRRARDAAATLLGGRPAEISLLGPTSLGINLVAHGIDWSPGDQVVYYPDDYPANVYPWQDLARRTGAEPVALKPPAPGVVTPELVEAALTPRTKLVALASCHYLTGYRIDVATIGALLRDRGILFSLDAIQTLGAWPFPPDSVDFLSADSHKWLLGPAGAGIFYVNERSRDRIRPSLLGSWNVVSPDFIAQPDILFEKGGRGFEPGMLNLPGIAGMAAAMELLIDTGVEAIADRLLHLRAHLLDAVRPGGWRTVLDGTVARQPANARSAIVTLTHPSADLEAAAKRLADARVTISLRKDRAGTPYLRLSPHFYNTEAELDRVAEALGG